MPNHSPAKLTICLSFFLCLSVEVFAETTIPYRNQTIKINPSNRPLITEIDVDKVMSRYLVDYDVFERRCMIGPSALIWRWNVKPDPSDPETQYFWGSKRNTPYYKRQFNLTIGVFSSHEEAVKRAVELMNSISLIVKLLDDGTHEPGYVAWERGYTVRDNVLYAIDFCTEPFNRAAWQKRLDREVLRGANGIEKGHFVEPPIIDGSEIPDEIIIPFGEKVILPLKASDPNSREIFRGIYFMNDKEESLLPVELRPESPSLDWITPDSLEMRENGSISGVLRAVAVNDRCVFSDIFEKRVTIKVPDSVK